MRFWALLTLQPAAWALSLPMWQRGGSRLFLDDASEAAWAELLPTKLFYGVTTNPLVLQKATVDCTVESVGGLIASAINDYHVTEIMVQCWGGSADAMEASGVAMVEASGVDSNRVVLKLPLTREGIVAANSLRESGMRICMTACYAKHQAVVAGAIGADYLAPYLGRMTDLGADGTGDCVAMERALRAMHADTRLLVASLRDVDALFDVLQQGADATFSATVARQLLRLDATEAAARDFELAAANELLLDVAADEPPFDVAADEPSFDAATDESPFDTASVEEEGRVSPATDL